MRRINAVFLTEALEEVLNTLNLYEGRKKITVENEICLPVRQSVSMLKKYGLKLESYHFDRLDKNTITVLRAVGVGNMQNANDQTKNFKRKFKRR